MKIEAQNNSDLHQLSELIDGISVCMMTNLDDTGALISRPMAPVEMDAYGALWFFTDARFSTVKHLRSVNLAFADVESSTYVSIAGYCEVNTERSRIKSKWTSGVDAWFPEGPDSENVVLLKFVPETAEYWDVPESKMVQMFAMVASMVTGERTALGEHQKLDHLSNTGVRSN